MKDGKTQGEGSSSVAVWVVCCCAAAHHLTTGMVHFLPALYALEMGASPAVIGMVPAAHSLPGLLLALPGGKVVDRLGPRRVALSATLCRVAAVLCYLLVPSPIWITIPSFLSGALGTFAVVSLHTYIGSLAVGTKRTQQISRFAVFTSAGELLAPALAGVLLDLFGFQVAFICAAATSFSTSACVFFLPGVSHQQERRSGEPAAARGFRGILRHEGMQVALWGIWSIASIQGFLRGFLPVLLRQSFPATQIGFLFLAASGASVAGRYAVGWMAGRWALAKIFPVSVGLAAASTMILPIFGGYSSLVAAMALFGLGNGLMSVLSLSLIADTVGRQERGLANGMRLTFMRLGSSTGPVIFGYLAGITSVASAFFGIGAVGLGVGLFLSASRFVRGTGLKTEGPRDS